jgi:hypothetical protein
MEGNIMKWIGFVLGMLLTFSVSAGNFQVMAYGTTTAGDYTDLITDNFLAAYNVDKYTLYVMTESGVLDTGSRYCFAVVGVTTKQLVTPRQRYMATKISNTPLGAMNAGEAHSLEVNCGRAAMESMMSDDVKRMYRRP